MPLIYYSLVLMDRKDAYPRRWIRSVRSLRQYNAKIPVHLFVFGAPPDSLRDAAERYEVVLRPCGDYRDHLAEAAGAAGAALSGMPTFQKLLPLQFIAPEVSNVLYLDCDTFFFADVETLFRKYRDCDWYAREEPGSRGSVLFRYDPRHVDEDALRRVAAALGVEAIPPCNFGVFLFNRRVRDALLALQRDFFTMAWKFAAGASSRLDCKMPCDLRARAAPWREIPGNRPLTYPSENFWIVDQVALWLIFGGAPHLSHGLFAEEDVLQGLEFLLHRSYRKWCTVAHYYSCNESLFLNDTGIGDALPPQEMMEDRP